MTGPATPPTAEQIDRMLQAVDDHLAVSRGAGDAPSLAEHLARVDAGWARLVDALERRREPAWRPQRGPSEPAGLPATRSSA